MDAVIFLKTLKDILLISGGYASYLMSYNP